MYTTFRHFLLGIFAVANNLPALGAFLALCNGVSQEESRRLAWIATISSLITMLLAMVTGQSILSFFGISINAFRATGGIILCLAGVNMLNANADDSTKNISIKTFEQKIPAVIVPIAIPLTTGAGTIATITIFAGELKLAHEPLWGLFGAILIMAGIIYVIFKYSTNLLSVLGSTGMNVLIKVTGIFTMAIGIQFIFDALTGVFPGLK